MWLFTRNNRNKGQKLKYNKKKTVTKSNFDPSKDTKFIIHGFGGSCKLKVLKKIRPALLKAVSNPNRVSSLFKLVKLFFFPCIYQNCRDVTTGKCYMRPLRWWAESAPLGWDRDKVSENLGATVVAPVAPVVTSLRSITN